MKMHSRRAAVVVAVVTTIATFVALNPSAQARASRGPALITDVHTIATFSYSAGQQAENITINPDGSLTVSMLGSPSKKAPELLRISPSGRQTVLIKGQVGDTIAGNARSTDGTIYYILDSSAASRSGVWRLRPHGAAQRIGAVPAGTFLNGLAVDSAGRTVYAADTLGSAIWSIPAGGGKARKWLVSPDLAPTDPAPDHYGANGLRFHDGALWVSDTNQGTLMRVLIKRDGLAGRIQTVASGLDGIDDFNFLTARSDVVFAALNGPNEVAVIYPNGESRIVLTAANGLDSPSATAVAGNRIYITNAGVATPYRPKLEAGLINRRALPPGLK